MRSIHSKKIAALALAALLLAGGLAILHFRIPQTDYSLLNDSNVVPIPVPSHLSHQQFSTARAAAQQVQLATIPRPPQSRPPPRRLSLIPRTHATPSAPPQAGSPSPPNRFPSPRSPARPQPQTSPR